MGTIRILSALVIFVSAMGVSVVPRPALAEWRIVSSVPTGDALVNVEVHGDLIVVVGLHFDMSNMFMPELHPRAFRSEDRGDSFTPIHGNMEAGEGFIDQPPEGIALSDSTILITRGEEVLRSGDLGLHWERHPVGHGLRELAYIGDEEVMGVGREGVIARSTDDGVTWSVVESPTTVELRDMMWRDLRGWAWGYDIEGSDDERRMTGGVLIETLDGGETWSTLRTFSGVGVGPGWFGGDLGFIGVSTPVQPGELEAVLSIFRTDDGGESWHDIDLPVAVGTMNMPMVGAKDITAGYLILIRVEGQYIRLATQALASETQSNGDKNYDWRLAGFISTDRGESWGADDLGEIPFDIMNPSIGDGNMLGGAMPDLHSGVLVTQCGRVYRLRTECESESDCFEGYECLNGACERDPASDPGDGWDDPEPEPSDGQDGSGNGFVVPGDPNGGGEGDDLEAGGCACRGSGGQRAALAVILLAFLAVSPLGRWSRRRPGRLHEPSA